MNSRQLQYAICLSQILNISQAAEKLNISQPALSKQILSLEKELGVVLFERNTTPLSLTAAGESFIHDAKEILFKEQELKRSMQDFKSGDKGRLVIGISPFRASYFLISVIRKLNEEYPALQVVLKEANSTQLQKETIDGQVDFTVMNLPVDEALLDAQPLESEPIVLAVPEKFARGLKIKSATIDGYPTIELSGCKDIPFIALSKTQELRRLFDKLCASSNITPNITTEVVGITTAWSLARAGIGATVLPLHFIEVNKLCENMMIFSLENAASVRKPAIVTRRGQHLSKYAKTAINLIKNR